MSRKKRIAFWSIVLVFFIVLIVSAKPSALRTDQKLKIGETTLNIAIAATEAERVQGLSGKKGLESDQGLLFVFEQPSYYGIWMKDMNFPIDIAWLDSDKRIVHIEKNIAPQSYPKIFYGVNKNQPAASLYILETSANFFENNKIEIGDQAVF